MRSRFTFGREASEILQRASRIEITVLRAGGKNVGIGYNISGDLLSLDEEADCADDGGIQMLPEATDRAERLMSFLLADQQGGAS